jgi:hypothetical protein
MTRKRGAYRLGLEETGCIGTRYQPERQELACQGVEERIGWRWSLDFKEEICQQKKSLKIYLYAKKQCVQEQKKHAVDRHRYIHF